MTTSCWIIIGKKNILDKVAEKIKTHILCSTTFLPPPPPPENSAIYENKSKNVVESEGPQMTSQYAA
jgi:hypothetical protein